MAASECIKIITYWDIVDVLEFQNAIILLHQEDKEDINRLILKLPKNYNVKKSTMPKTLQ